jgi:membrane-anchored protein YejM (alkaline phosphatase superfamily)
MGVFSFFYGLPPAYWASFESLQRSSVLVDELQSQGYQLGLFSSATMYRPVTLDRTAFANVQELRLQTEPADASWWEKDLIMTGDWENWLDRKVQNANGDAPFFGFLFYNATNAIEYPPEMDFPADFDPDSPGDMETRFSNYRKSVHFFDSLFERVMKGLESRRLLDSTVVMVTSDHGEEFEEIEQGLSGHGSGYTPLQLQVPMLIFWPGKTARVFNHRSSHYDVVPTLMEELLGCGNSPTDFASGHNLFEARNWDWLVAGSYYNYAVLEPDQVTITFPNGSFEIRNLDYSISKQPQIRTSVLEAVSKENARFFR